MRVTRPQFIRHTCAGGRAKALHCIVDLCAEGGAVAGGVVRAEPKLSTV